jgi:hypothetical protein
MSGISQKNIFVKILTNIWTYFSTPISFHKILPKKSNLLRSIPITLCHWEQECKRTRKINIKHVVMKLDTAFKTIFILISVFSVRLKSISLIQWSENVSLHHVPIELGETELGLVSTLTKEPRRRYLRRLSRSASAAAHEATVQQRGTWSNQMGSR